MHSGCCDQRVGAFTFCTETESGLQVMSRESFAREEGGLHLPQLSDEPDATVWSVFGPVLPTRNPGGQKGSRGW